MAEPYQCYLSFCEEDVDLDDLQLFVREFRKRAGQSVELLYYKEEKYGSSFDNFISKLDHVPAALALLTPQYRERVDVRRQRTTGVYREYERIVARLRPARTPTDRLLFVPVYWKGESFRESFPKEFFNRTYAPDLSDFHAHKYKGKLRLPEVSRAIVGRVLSKIASDLKADRIQREAEQSEQGMQLQAMLVDDAQVKTDLIAHPDSSIRIPAEEAFQLKFERQIAEISRFREDYFVETSFYRTLKRQEHYIYSGRKGSGKTTLAQIFIFDHSRTHLPPIDVQVNDWKLHAIFDDVIMDQISGDMAFIQQGSQLFTLVWVAFIAFSVIRSHHVEGSILDEELSDVLPNEYVRQIFRDSIDRYSRLFQASFLSIKAFADLLIEEAPRLSEERFRLHLSNHFTLNRFGEFLFGEDFAGLRRVISAWPDRRVIFCLDRFDTELQEYRKAAIQEAADSGVVTSRLLREVDWLKGLVTAIDQCKSRDRLTPDTRIFELFHQLDFFVVLPSDRFQEVRDTLRDSVAIDRGMDVQWKPKELMTMLRRRLQLVAGIDLSKADKKRHPTPRARYDFLVKGRFSEMPDQIPIRIGRDEFQTDLFLAVLRHTFWRPRDVMLYYLPIIQRLMRCRESGERILDPAVVRMIISQRTRDLVNTEFIQEFGDSFSNLEDVLHKFKGRNQALSFEEIEQMLGGMPFKVINRDKITSIFSKLEVLYDIGFLGIRVGKQFGSLQPTGDFTFSFMQREKLVDFDVQEMVRGATFAVHPVFVESLSLVPGDSITGGGRPVMNFDWNFIEQNDAMEAR